MAIRKKKQADSGNLIELEAPDMAVPANDAGTGDILSYIQDMSAELRDMADGRDLLLLSYLLDMAHQEARQLATRRTTGKS